jgi:class 3 adenylate cyclase
MSSTKVNRVEGRNAAMRIAWKGQRIGPVPLAVVLGITIGALVSLSVVLVLAIGWFTASSNTQDLLAERFRLMLTVLENQVNGELEPARKQMESVSRLLTSGAVDLGDRQAVQSLLLGAIATTPQVKRLVVIGTDHRVVGAEWHDNQLASIDHSAGPRLAEQYDEVMTSDQTAASWLAPTYLGPRMGSALVLQQPLLRDGHKIGALILDVTVGELSEFIRTLDNKSSDARFFILYGADHVLAHAAMAADYPNLSRAHPLPKLDEVGDPVLASAWSRFDSPLLDLPGLDVQSTPADGKEWLILLKNVRSYGPGDLIIGLYMPNAAIGHDIERLRWAAGAGLGVLILSLVAAGWLGRRIADPMRDVATHATAISRLDLHDLVPLPRSLIRELDVQSEAFNAMEVSLRWFAAYIPRSLVQRLISRGEVEGIPAVERAVTVMFTDIAGFTHQAERLSATDTAAFLNDHFSLLIPCIEAEGGTVDKFIGDSVMAFWNAPEPQPDHADRACRAALAIRAAVCTENDARCGRGEPPIRLRIGIHTGLAVIGNIGSAERVNYTVVGDTVNVAQRCEALAKELNEPHADVTILVSSQTRSALNEHTPMSYAGALPMKRRTGSIEVYQISQPTVPDWTGESTSTR